MRCHGANPDLARDATAASAAAPTAVEHRWESCALDYRRWAGSHLLMFLPRRSAKAFGIACGAPTACENSIVNRLLCLATPLVRTPGERGVAPVPESPSAGRVRDRQGHNDNGVKFIPKRCHLPSPFVQVGCWNVGICSILQSGCPFWLDPKWTKRSRPRGMTRKGPL